MDAYTGVEGEVAAVLSPVFTRGSLSAAQAKARCLCSEAGTPGLASSWVAVYVLVFAAALCFFEFSKKKSQKKLVTLSNNTLT